MENKVNLIKYKKDIYFINDISGDFISRYSATDSAYICDAIADIADDNVDIYYSDRAAWFAENWEKVDDAIAELGSSGEIMQDIAAAQFIENEQNIAEDLTDIIKYLAIDYLIDLEIYELSENELENLENELENLDSNNRLYNITDILHDTLNLENDDTVEE